MIFEGGDLVWVFLKKRMLINSKRRKLVPHEFSRELMTMHTKLNFLLMFALHILTFRRIHQFTMATMMITCGQVLSHLSGENDAVYGEHRMLPSSKTINFKLNRIKFKKKKKKKSSYLEIIMKIQKPTKVQCTMNLICIVICARLLLNCD
ncbi:unnamed protein product [Musa textilis]